jgi:hypothetical protein
MPGRRAPPPVKDIPLNSLVRCKKTHRIGVLVSYGQKAARVTFDPKARLGSGWIKLRHMEAVTPEELAEILRKEAEDLV